MAHGGWGLSAMVIVSPALPPHLAVSKAAHTDPASPIIATRVVTTIASMIQIAMP